MPDGVPAWRRPSSKLRHSKFWKPNTLPCHGGDKGTRRAGVVSCSWFYISPRGWEARDVPPALGMGISQSAR